MSIKLFNTLTRSLQEFIPLDPAGKTVGLYCCGPTVYDLAHIGNFRTFVFADVVRRYLEFAGFEVRHVMNITDVDDKIIARVKAGEIALVDFTRPFEAAFFEDLLTLGCRHPQLTPHATEHIADMVAMIEKLMARGVAYQADDGSVYFSIEKYRAQGHLYGQLTPLNIEELRVGERVRNDEYAKESVADFALWKARVPEDGAVFWPSPWGEGRPGWHIECSAMSTRLLGPTFDLHLGGEDLKFPHHEDEIAQSEGCGIHAPGQHFVNYWLHCAHLLVEGRKMAKSLGNFFTLRDLLAKGFTGREVRFLLLTTHYRESFNFTLDGLHGARATLARLDECLGKLREIAGSTQSDPDPVLVSAFAEKMNEDLNLSAVWGAVFEWVRACNRAIAEHTLSPAQASAACSAWQRLDSVLGVGAKISAEAPDAVLALLEKRQAARKARDFQRADAVRAEIKAQGWIIEDTPKGPKLKPA